MTRTIGREMGARVDRWASRVDVLVLLGIAALHVAWAHGRSWPLPDRQTLARTVLGVEKVEGKSEPGLDAAAPATAECYAVAAALMIAAGLVAGHPRARPAVRRRGVGGLVVVLGGRGLLGLAGKTSLVVPMATGPTFVRLDRRFYGPLCLLLAGLSSRSFPRRRGS